MQGALEARQLEWEAAQLEQEEGQQARDQATARYRRHQLLIYCFILFGLIDFF